MKLAKGHHALKNYTEELEKFQERLGEDLKRNTKLDTINQRNVNNVESSENWTNTLTWSFGGTTIGLGALGALSLIILCACKQRSQQGMNVNISRGGGGISPPRDEHQGSSEGQGN